MSTCFWAVKDNEVYTPLYASVLENIEKSKRDILIESVEGRHRVKIKNAEFWQDLDEEDKQCHLAFETFMEQKFNSREKFNLEEFLKKDTYYWIDGRETPDGEEVVGLTRYAGNSGIFVESLMTKVFGCGEVVCEHDDLERLVEVGLYDPCVLEDEEDEDDE